MPFGVSSGIPNVIIHAKFHVDRLKGFWAAGPPKVPFLILIGTTLTTVLHYRADCDVATLHRVLIRGEILVENRRFKPTPPLFVTTWEFQRDLWSQKTRVSGLSYAVVCVILRSAMSVRYRLVTNRRTDGRTHDDSIYRAIIASRGNKKRYPFHRRTEQKACDNVWREKRNRTRGTMQYAAIQRPSNWLVGIEFNISLGIYDDDDDDDDNTVSP